jgi:hypothetical protein
MLSLRELQKDFCLSIRGFTPVEFLQLVHGDGFNPSARLSIYRNNVVKRLTESLSATYPVACKLVDPHFFAYAADQYIRRHLPTAACLVDYGADFPCFLAEFPPAATLNYLADVARLEWSVHRVLLATPVPPIAVGALADFDGDPAELRLRIAPSVAFVASPYAIDQIWIAHQGGDGLGNVRLQSSGVYLQVSGSDGIQILDLPPATWELRSRLANGEPLGTSLGKAAALDSDFDAGSALATLFNDGLVVGLAADSEPLGIPNTPQLESPPTELPRIKETS